ncbi:hypothetical protein O3G_MSEX011038 [Manduca sexta]|nr:hypothetical protein O3G_MSEX011038 [Manduca sexta]
MLSLLVPLWVVASALSVLSGALGEPERSGPVAAPAPPAALEKRSPHYDFGLGKRAYSYVPSVLVRPRQALGGGGSARGGYEVKRARPYSFGLGKRLAEDETSEEKRARMYDFGLGKRLPMYNFGLGKRAKSYNFGLGKRLSSKFNFGLGKRERDMNRFRFGLGKRSEGELPAAPAAAPADTDNYFDI